jgi:plastocyanin
MLIMLCYAAFLLYLVFLLLTILQDIITNSAFAIESSTNPIHASQQGNFNATAIYDTKTMTMRNHIRNLIILIPNEGHHGPNGELEQRLINQPYVPQKTIVNIGTMIIWFNADVGHDHNIILTDDTIPEKILFSSGNLTFNETSKPILLNSTGTYRYYESNPNYEDEDFVMNGTITVVNQTHLSDITNANTTTDKQTYNASSRTSNSIDTAGVYMVPAKDLYKYFSKFADEGFIIESTYTFKALSGGQERTGEEQTLFVWETSSSSINLDKVISTLKEITPELPYE